jgi:hypothetical protein
MAQATGNPQFQRLLGFLEQYLREAMRVTRGNEARHRDFADAVRTEHHALVDAIAAGDATAARRAATRHMQHACRPAGRRRRRGGRPHPPPRPPGAGSKARHERNNSQAGDRRRRPRLDGLRRRAVGAPPRLRHLGHRPALEARERFAPRAAPPPPVLPELATACDVVVVLVVNAAQTEDVLFGDGGLAEARCGAAAWSSPRPPSTRRCRRSGKPGWPSAACT